MIKKLLSISIIVLLISSCGNTGKKEAAAKVEGTDSSNKVEFATLMENPGSYVGKTISVEGKVVHVCTHSGKKLFITGENPDVRLYVQAGEEMPKFPMELLGSEIVVEGTITQAAATPSAEMAEMQEGEGAAKAVGADTCETAKALASQPVLADLMMIYNKHEVVK
ncbi:MAG: hypothetical protein H6R35_1168 [Bacteroidetes bacterium]|nr:hypothetical protein [Bacteroidota bacterium]